MDDGAHAAEEAGEFGGDRNDRSVVGDEADVRRY